MSNVAVIAPHPDDETLGCGGTILKHVHSGDKVYWIIVTSIDEKNGFSLERVNSRKKEIEKVSKLYNFEDVIQFNIPTTTLDQYSKSSLIEKFDKTLKEIKAEIIYLPFKGDVHSDHKMTFDAVISATKSFRNPLIKSLLCYETLSETNFGLDPMEQNFKPNIFIDISAYLEEKMEILKIFKSELGEHPFPRSEKAVQSLAALRGSMSGCDLAEGFLLLKEIR